MAATDQCELTREDKLAWRDILGTPGRERSALAIAFAALQMAVIPFSENRQLAVFYLLLTFGFYYLLTRSLVSLAGLAIPAFLVYSFGESYFGGGLAVTVSLVAVLFGGALGGYVLLHFRTKPVHLSLLAVPVLTWGLTFLATSDPMRGLLTLLPLPLAVVLALLVSRCSRCTEATVAGAAAMACTLALALVLTLAATGRLHGNILGTLAEEVRVGLVRSFTELRTAYEEAGLSYNITDVSISNSATVLVNLIPALFLILCSVISFLCYRVFVRVVVSFDEIHRMPRRILEFTVSPATAVLFLAVFVISLFAGSSHASFASVVLQNLYLVLEPGLIVVGFSSLFGRGAASSCLSVLILFGLLFTLFTNPGTGLTLAAFYGALSILATRFFPTPNEKGGL